MFSLLPDEEAAAAIKATTRYYLYGEEPTDLKGGAAEVFQIMCANIDRDRETYRKRCEGGKRGNEARWHSVR